MTGKDEESEIAKALEEEPETSAYYAATEMHYGRLRWLAEHIRQCNFIISSEVARKLLAMLEGSDPDCLFEIKAIRRSDLPPNLKDRQLRLFRAADMAVEVARLCQFKRGQLKKACFDIGEIYGLKAEYVRKEIKPFQDYALDYIAEENARTAYQNGETDFLGAPKNP